MASHPESAALTAPRPRVRLNALTAISRRVSSYRWQRPLSSHVDSANVRVGPWLVRTANARKHGTTDVPPDHRLQKELATLLPLPVLSPSTTPRLAEPQRRTVPVESIQHPLSVYQSLLEVRL